MLKSAFVAVKYARGRITEGSLFVPRAVSNVRQIGTKDVGTPRNKDTDRVMGAFCYEMLHN